MMKSFVLIAALLFCAPAFAGQVPSPINAPASVGSNDLLQASGTKTQQAADSGKTAPSGAIVGTSDTQTLTNKSIDASEINSSSLAVAHGGTNATGGNAALANLSGSYTICQSGAASAITGTTAETNLAICAIPANTLAANSCLEVMTVWSMTNNSDTKTLAWRLSATSGGTNGTKILNIAVTTNASYQDIRWICDANSTSAQIAFGGGGATGGSGGGPASTSISMTALSYINFTGQDNTSGSDTVTLLAWYVRVQSTNGN